MKTIYKINLVMVSAVLLICSTAGAQEKYSTAARIGKQLKENSVPGLKYGPEPQQKQTFSADGPKQDTNGDIRAVIFTRGVPSTAAQTLKTNRSAAAKSASAALPSDAKLPEPDQKKTAPPKLPPMQTE